MKVSRKLIREILLEKFYRDDFRDVYATARMAHVGQKRRSGEDYFTHPAEVRNIVNRFYPDDRISQLAALLHDTLEDAPGSTVDSIEEMEGFIKGSITDPRAGEEVTRVVRALTHEKGGDYQSYVVDLIGDQPALRVKLADMVHNLSSSPSPKQKKKYRAAIDAISDETGGTPPAGISQQHWDRLYSLTENKARITETQLRKIIHQVLLAERKTIATVSDVTKFKPQIEEWVEILIDELVIAVPRMEAMDEKRRNSVIDGLTGKVVSALIDVTSSMTDYDRSNHQKEKFKKEYEKERIKRSSGSGQYYGGWGGFS